VQTGWCASTRQNAFVAHGSDTAHGLRHWRLMQALCGGHSELSVHSGASGSIKSGSTEIHKTRRVQIMQGVRYVIDKN